MNNVTLDEYRFFSSLYDTYKERMEEYVLYKLGHPETVAKVKGLEHAAREAEAKQKAKLAAQVANTVCPFCHSKASIGFRTERVCCGHGDYRDKVHAICGACQATMSVWGDGTEGKIAAINKWNNARKGYYGELREEVGVSRPNPNHIWDETDGCR